MAINVKQMEQDLLETARDKAPIGLVGEAGRSARQFLADKYPSKEESQQLTVVMQYLLEERYIYPFFDGVTKLESRDYVRGITPKGMRRLEELQAPRRAWFRDNWFPATIAGITAGVSITSLILNTILN